MIVLAPESCPAATVLVVETPAAAARAAAQWLLQRFDRAEDAHQDGRVRLGLAGGTTPGRLYQLLAGELAARVPWRRLELYFGDERCVPSSDPQSNLGMARRTLLAGRPDGETPVHGMFFEGPRATDPRDAAASYEAVLPAALDVLLLGLGPDGHTCSLFPGHAALDERVRRVVAIDDSPKPPPHRITLTPSAIDAARELLVLATGEDKADAVARCLAPSGTIKACPGRLARRGTWILDDDAASRLAPAGQAHPDLAPPRSGRPGE